METINQILEHPTYKKMMSDSFGGVMFNVANRPGYMAEGGQELVDLFAKLTPAEKESSRVGGIMRGTISFLEGRY